MKTYEAAPDETTPTLKTYEADPDSDMLPEYANGMDSSRPINKSPLDSTQRFKLFALGNKQGQLAELGKLFPEGAELDRDGNFTVKKDGLWHKTDANTLQDVDAWTATKGVLRGVAAVGAGIAVGAADLLDKAQGLVTGKDFIPDPQMIVDMISGDNAIAQEVTGEVAENADLAAAFAVPGAGAAAGIGRVLATSAAAAGGMKALTSSMGRLEGTYEADLDTQALDIGKDMLFALGGASVALGAKPTAQWFAKTKAAEKIGNALKMIPEEARQAVTKAVTAPYNKMAQIGRQAQGIGADDVTNMVEHTADVQRVLNMAGAAGDRDAGTVIIRSANKVMTELADAADQAVKETWERGQQNLMNAVDGAGIKIGAKEATEDTFNWMLNNGLLRLRSSATPERIAKLKAGGRDISQFYTLKTQRGASRAAAKANLTRSDLAFSDEAWESLERLWPKLQDIRRAPANSGMEGVANAIQATKLIRSMTNTARLAGAKEGDDILLRFATEVGEGQKKGMMAALEKQSPQAAAAYKSMIDDYSAISELAEPLKKAIRSENPEAMSNLFNQFSARAGKNEQGVKAPLEGLVDLVTKNGYRTAGKLADSYSKIKAHKTAGVLANVTGARNFWGGGAGGLAATSFMTGNPAIGGAIVGQHIARHPMTTFNAIKLGKASVAAMRMLDHPALMKTLRDPRAAYAITNGWLDAEQAENQAREMFMQQVPGANGGQQ